MLDLSIIIVHYKSIDKTRNCLDAIKRSKTDDLRYEIFVVDNDSRDEISRVLEEKHPDVRLIVSDVNLGMGKGNNLGIKEAQGKYVLILNPDTELEEAAIQEMIRHMEADGNVGMIGPRLYYPDGQIQQSYYKYPNILMPIMRRTFLGKIFRRYIENYLMLNLNPTDPTEVDWLMGSVLMTQKEILDEVGAFDDRFFMYFEDTDLCRRIKRSGRKVVYHPKATAIHHHARASAELPWYIAPFKSKMSRVHIQSFFKYMWKWKFR